MTKRKTVLAIKLAITFLILFFVYKKIDIIQIVRTIPKLNIYLFILGSVISFIAFGIDCYKLKISLSMFNTSNAINYFKILGIQLVARLFGTFLPGGQLASESIKTYKLFKFYPQKNSIVSVGIEKIMGFIGLIFVTTFLLFLDVRHKYNLQYIFLSFLIFISVMLYVLANVRINRFLEMIGKRSGSLFIDNMLKHLIEFSAILAKAKKNHSKLFSIFLIASVSQLIGIVSIYFLAKSVSINISLITIGWISGVFGIIQLLPVTIAGLGIREVSYAFFLKDYGIGFNQTVVFCITLYLVWFFYLVAGITAYFFEK